jgi:hypothetical protein
MTTRILRKREGGCPRKTVTVIILEIILNERHLGSDL